MEKQSRQTSNEVNKVKPKNKVIYKWCIVPRCKNTTKKTPKKLFVNVPKRSKIRRQWLRLAGRDPDDIVDDSTVFICEDHFDMEKDMANYYQYKMGFSKHILMVEGVQPSKFYCEPRWRRKMRQKINAQNALAERQRTQLIDELIQKSVETPTPIEDNITDTSMLFTVPNSESDPIFPHINDELKQCRACAEFTKDFIDVTMEPKPYITENNTALLMNNLSVGLDFSDNTLPKTVCCACDQKLQEMYNFVMQIKAAQTSLINISDSEMADLRDLELPVLKSGCDFLPDIEDEIMYNNNDKDQLNLLMMNEPSMDQSGIAPIIDEGLPAQEEPKVNNDVDSENAELLDFINKNVFYLEPDDGTQKSIDPGLATHSLVVKDGDGTYFQVLLTKE